MSQETEWFQDQDEQRRKTVSPYWFIAFLIFVVGTVLYAAKVSADPLFSATAEGATITLTDEPCKVPAIGNLPFRAVWVEKDKTYEGCFGVRQDLGVVLAYFDDRSVALIPIQLFRKVVGA